MAFLLSITWQLVVSENSNFLTFQWIMHLTMTPIDCITCQGIGPLMLTHHQCADQVTTKWHLRKCYTDVLDEFLNCTCVFTSTVVFINFFVLQLVVFLFQWSKWCWFTWLALVRFRPGSFHGVWWSFARGNQFQNGQNPFLAAYHSINCQ